MGQSVNLIPDQEVQEQTKTKAVKLSTVFSILILIVISGVSAYFMVSLAKVKSQINNEENNINTLRSDINKMSSIEINARTLGKKFNALTGILKKRQYYSLLLQEFAVRKPAEITVEAFSVLKDNKISISGNAPSYIIITTFSNNLLEKDFQGGNKNLSGLFKSITLNSVDLAQSGQIKYSITIEYDPSKLIYVY